MARKHKLALSSILDLEARGLQLVGCERSVAAFATQILMSGPNAVGHTCTLTDRRADTIGAGFVECKAEHDELAKGGEDIQVELPSSNKLDGFVRRLNLARSAPNASCLACMRDFARDV